MYIRAYNYLRSTGAQLRAQNHTSRFGLLNHFRSVYFRFRLIQDGARADIEVGQLVGAGKPVGSMYRAWILRYH